MFSSELLVPDDDRQAVRRRAALVLARESARPATPPGIDREEFARACLEDTYEVTAGLVGVVAGIIGDDIADLLWPAALQFPAGTSITSAAGQLAGEFDELIVVTADVPDLPQLVLAKVFKTLQRSPVCIAPSRGRAAHGGSDRGETGWVAIGLQLPLAPWAAMALTEVGPPDPSGDPDTSDDPEGSDLVERIRAAAPRRGLVGQAPDWSRLRTPGDIHQLDPGLEGWDQTRALLSGRGLTG